MSRFREVSRNEIPSSENEKIDESNLSDEELMSKKFESLDDEEKDKIISEFLDDEAFHEWEKKNPDGSRNDYLSSLMKEYNKIETEYKISLTDYEADESNSDLAGKPREVQECGLSKLMTLEAYEKTLNGEYENTYGYKIGEVGQFISPTAQINELLEKSNGDLSIINEKLGVDWKTSTLVRVSISKEDAEKLNPIYPTGKEIGANEKFIGGGKTLIVDKETDEEKGYGLDEYTIDPIDINDIDSLEITYIPLKKKSE